ncbi:MAG: hypothetical protein LRY56_05970 [Burkholderiaceae bacterium]|nr:hypothetical protein [Burkholderiaceae bacterium]
MQNNLKRFIISHYQAVILTFLLGLLLLAHARALAQPYMGQVTSVTQETFASVARPQVCWQSIVTAHQKAVAEQASTPWLVRNWQPILGAGIGGAIAYQFTGNYGTSSQKWIWPTVAGGAIVGAVAGPGPTAAAYGLGTLAHSIWPTSLPLTAGFSLAGAILGKIVWDIVFPPNAALQAPQPGQFLPNQTFYLQTNCTKPERIEYKQAPYLVTYRYQGKTHTARVKYYPGARIELTAAGRPVMEVPGTR